MYSGTTISKGSGKFLGAHQKIDRVALRALRLHCPDAIFPDRKAILHFEGMNGPDAIKRKSPAKDEPWHYYNPLDGQDFHLLSIIEDHHAQLASALSATNLERAAFEAAWLAHAIVDGLTPAHQYPLEKKLQELRGETLATRTSIWKKLIIQRDGDNRRQVLVKNWDFWGAKGIMTTHGLFEWGVATTIAPLRLRSGYPKEADYRRVLQEGLRMLFKEAAFIVYDLHMYDQFYRRGWTRHLAKQTRTQLAPLLVKIVALSWYSALQTAGRFQDMTQ